MKKSHIILVALVMLGLLMGCSEEPASTGSTKTSQAKTECRTLEHAIEVYFINHNAHNVSKDEVLQLVVEAGILKEKRVPKDPWGRDYVVTIDDGRIFAVHSMGDNGSDGDEDDVFSDGLRKDSGRTREATNQSRRDYSASIKAREAREARRASERWSCSEWILKAWEGHDYRGLSRVGNSEFFRKVGRPFRIELNQGVIRHVSLYWSCKDGLIHVKVDKRFWHMGEILFLDHDVSWR